MPSLFGLNQTIQEQMQVEGHRWGNLGYWNGKFLAILNLSVDLMPPIKFKLSSTYSLRRDIV